MTPFLDGQAINTLDHIFNPKSVAIVGASEEKKKLGNRILANLINKHYSGNIYPVNPNADTILGLSAYRDVKDIPSHVDLAVVVVPEPVVIESLQSCLEKGVKAAILITAGFAETGDSGKKKQEDLDRIARLGLRLVGPNCEGVLNNAANVDLTFCAKSPPRGSIAFISQSGALGANTIFRWASERDVGISMFASIGNEADLCSSDYLEYFAADPGTRVIMMYLEGVKDGRRFLPVAKEITKSKPIVLFKGGVTSRGAEAVASHTGVLAGSGEVFDAACRQAGITRVNDADELFDVAITFDGQPLPTGRKVGLVTGAGGGMGVIATDSCVKFGLEVPRFSDETIAKMKSILPPYAPVDNPVDLTAIFDPLRLVKCTEIALQDSEIDSVIGMGFGWRQDLFVAENEAVSEFIGLKSYSKPILVVCPSSKHEFESLRRLESASFPVFLTPRKAAYALSCMVSYAETRSRRNQEKRVRQK